jgi:hypothetical protein
MNKKISLITALAIATILTAYISALTLSNQAFAVQGTLSRALGQYQIHR